MTYALIAFLGSLLLSSVVALLMGGFTHMYYRWRGGKVKLSQFWNYSPLVLGCNSILFSSLYLLGRTPGPIGHAIFLHFDAVGAVSGYSAICGVGVGAYLLKEDRTCRIIQCGFGLSLVALILGVFGLPL